MTESMIPRIIPEALQKAFLEQECCFFIKRQGFTGNIKGSQVILTTYKVDDGLFQKGWCGLHSCIQGANVGRMELGIMVHGSWIIAESISLRFGVLCENLCVLYVTQKKLPRTYT